jgi:hypothetical protein
MKNVEINTLPILYLILKLYVFLARLFEEKKSSYCRHSGVSVWVG